MIKIFTTIIFLLLIGYNANAANIYVRDGGTATNCRGTDWNTANACDSLATAEGLAVRGDTIYVADGTYTGSTITFDVPVSSTTTITIKKATASDHGTETGWSSGYGDGQATLPKLIFSTSYWELNGVARNASDWSSQTGYGFVISGGAGGNEAKLITVTSADYITIRYVFAYFDAVKTSGDVSANRDQGVYSLSGTNNLTFEYSAIKNTSYKASFLINDTNGPLTIRYNWIENAYKKETFSARNTNNVTYAFNKHKNIAGTGAIVADSSDTWSIYGNTFWSPSGSYTFTDVIIGTWTGDHPDRDETLNTWLIYNNTFYQMNGATQIQIQKGTGNEVKNNLFIGFTSSINGSLTSATNTQNAATSVVTDSATGDFTLTGATANGTTLSSPYNADLTGATRGADGVWDTGAYEYDGSGGGDADPTVTITSPTSATTYNTSETSVNISGTAGDDISVSSVAWACPECTPTSGACTGTTSWTASSIGLATGANIITVTVTDSGSNTAQDVLTVYRSADSTAPVISNKLPTGTITYAATINLECDTDKTATCKADLSQALYDDMLISMTASVNHHTAERTGILPNTTYKWYVRCRDSIGNTSDATAIDFTTGASAPSSLTISW